MDGDKIRRIARRLAVNDDTETKLLGKVPKQYRRRRSNKYDEGSDICSPCGVGTVPVFILCFAPNVSEIVNWLTPFARQLAPSAVKSFMMQRDLQRLSRFYASLTSSEGTKVHRFVDETRVLRRIYDGASLKYPRNIRLLANALLDQVLWRRADPASATITLHVYPPAETIEEFRLSRVDYLLSTKGASSTCSELQSSKQLLPTIETICRNYQLQPSSKAFPLLDFLNQMIPALPPVETLQALATCRDLPLVIQRSLYEYIWLKIHDIRNPRRLARLVKRTIGHPLFLWCILEVQTVRIDGPDVSHRSIIMEMQRYSRMILNHLQAIRYRFLQGKQGRRLLRKHPAHGGSYVAVVDDFMLVQRSTAFRPVVERVMASNEFAVELVASLSDPEHKQHPNARYMLSQIGHLPAWKPNPLLHLRILDYHPQLDEVTRLAVFEGFSDSIHSTSGYKVLQAASAIDEFGMDRFVRIVVDVYMMPTRPGPSQATVYCIQSYTLRLLTILLEESTLDFSTRLRNQLTSLREVKSRLRITSISQPENLDHEAWDTMLKKIAILESKTV